MGRRTFCDNDTAKCHLFRVRMVDGDYDDGGAYWGGPPSEPLWCVRDKRGGDVLLFYRARNREAALALVREEYPELTFYPARS
jgi:hypothetical protein